MSAIIPAAPSGDLIISTTPPPERNPAMVYIASLPSAKSRRVQLNALDTIARRVSGINAVDFPWHTLQYQHVQAIRTALMQDYKPATVNRMLSAVRRVLKEAWRLGYLSADEYQRAADVANVKSETLPAGRSLGSGEIVALLAACGKDRSVAGVRDAAMTSTLYGAGLRRAEIVGIELDDYTPESGQIVIRGKGRKERTAYLPEGAGAAMADWLAVRGDDPGPLFCAISRGGVLQCKERGLTSQAVYNMLQKRGREAGLKSFSPHDLRRSFVSDMLDNGADIATVQKMAGHASPTTTARYDRRGEEAKRKAAGLLHVPYTAR